jgi:hypothetical protein
MQSGKTEISKLKNLGIHWTLLTQEVKAELKAHL